MSEVLREMCKRKNWFKRFIVSLLLGLSLVCLAPKTIFADIEPYKLKESSITRVVEQQQVKGKILIYHTHTLEDYVDSNVVEMGADLKAKLEKKGYIVDHVEDNFSVDYNNAYNSSREYLQSINLGEYDLIIDYHRNSPTLNNTVKVKDVDVARGMFVLDKWSPNFEEGQVATNGIVSQMDKFNGNIMRYNFYYEGGINGFNTDLSKNIVLLEAGDANNNKLEVMRLNTYMSASIDTYLSKN